MNYILYIQDQRATKTVESINVVVTIFVITSTNSTVLSLVTLSEDKHVSERFLFYLAGENLNQET